MRKSFIAGNWKMNMDSQTAVELAKAVSIGCLDLPGEGVDVAVIPPSVYLQSVAGAVNPDVVSVGAQNVYYEKAGAFTGEVSTAMLRDVGCAYVLCGHSERRHVIGENDELVNKKVMAAIEGGLLPILCVGETLEEREGNKTAEVVSGQIRKGLAGIDSGKASLVTIAYEPVWAIGTGLTATPEQAQEVHLLIRKLLEKLYDDQLAGQCRIQYGGSAKPGNAGELMAKPDIDGLLVGGASLKAEDFLGIIKAAM